MSRRRLDGICAVTIDFGNTLVPVRRAALREVVARTSATTCAHLGLGEPGAFVAAWAEERERQFREEVPRFREVDLRQRAVRVIARLRGFPVPQPDGPWDDDSAAAWSTGDEVDDLLSTYSEAFVAVVPAPPASGMVMADLAARGFRVAILSNWPLAATIDRFVEAAGWRPLLTEVFVSERIGTIKPHPAIFAHAAAELDVATGAILHVGDDWAADVVGAIRAGWRAAYLRDHQGDTPLPTSARSHDGDVAPDLELHDLAELGAQLGDPSP